MYWTPSPDEMEGVLLVKRVTVLFLRYMTHLLLIDAAALIV